MLRLILKDWILSSSMESTTYKPTLPRWAKKAVSLPNIFLEYSERQILSKHNSLLTNSLETLYID